MKQWFAMAIFKQILIFLLDKAKNYVIFAFT